MSFTCFEPYLISSKKTSRNLISGTIEINEFTLKLPKGDAIDADTGLSKPYLNKRTVLVDGQSLFGELAIVYLLKKSDWRGVWVDSFGKGKKFKLWERMPPTESTQLSGIAKETFDKIVEANGGKLSGFFDVFAWQENKFAFFEYKGPRDTPNDNEIKWLASALKFGIHSDNFYVIKVVNS